MLAQTQQSRSTACCDGGSHCRPSTRSECRRGRGGSRICSNEHTTHSHPKYIPSPPTHTTCPLPHIISCCPLEPVYCIMSHRYLGNDLISLDDDGPSFDKAIMSICNLPCHVKIWSGVSCLHSRADQRLKEKQTNEEIKIEISKL